MTTPFGGLDAAIEKQRLLVARHGSENLLKFERIIGLLPVLRDRLGLGRFLGALVIDHKPRVLYRFLLTTDSPITALRPQVVLKIYGDQPRGEGPLQQLWRDWGVNVPRLFCGEMRGCSWLAIEYLKMSPVIDCRHDQFELVDHLAQVGKTIHSPAHDVVALLRPLQKIMVPRWKEAASVLRRSGIDVPSSWLNRASAAYASGNAVPLHGDLAPANMGRNRTGQIIVFDASALHGAASFDAARWSARTGPGGVGPEALLKHWISIEGLPSGHEPWELLAAECVVEAGSREIMRCRVMQKPPSQSSEAAPDSISELLRTASQQWS